MKYRSGNSKVKPEFKKGTNWKTASAKGWTSTTGTTPEDWGIKDIKAISSGLSPVTDVKSLGKKGKK